MKSSVIKHSIVVNGRKTSISIEEAFWTSLKQIATEQGMTLSQLVGAIRAEKTSGSNLSSAIRVYILNWFRSPTGNHPGVSDPVKPALATSTGAAAASLPRRRG